MSDTRMDDPVDVIPNRVRGYRLANGQVKNSEFIDISSRFGGGGTRSTVPDLLKYATGIMDGKLLNNESTIAATTSMSTMVDEAMALLSTAIELYPKEANLYDSLGEFQLRKGDKVKALASYQKALEVDPNFSNAAAAREVVKKLSEETAQKN
jgi:tetratricopeptide (TPR) repeat protein